MDSEQTRRPERAPDASENGIPIDEPEASVAPAKILPVVSRCPYCRADVRAERADWVACEGCLARHHASCWREHGSCSSCGSTRVLVRGASRAGRSGRLLVGGLALLGVLAVGGLARAVVSSANETRKLGERVAEADERAAARDARVARRLRAVETALEEIDSRESELGDRVAATTHAVKRASDATGEADSRRAAEDARLARRLRAIEGRLDELAATESTVGERLEASATGVDELAKRVEALARSEPARGVSRDHPSDDVKQLAGRSADRIVRSLAGWTEALETAAAAGKAEELLSRREVVTRLLVELAELCRIEGLPASEERAAVAARKLAQDEEAVPALVARLQKLTRGVKSEREELRR